MASFSWSHQPIEHSADFVSIENLLFRKVWNWATVHGLVFKLSRIETFSSFFLFFDFQLSLLSTS